MMLHKQEKTHERISYIEQKQLWPHEGKHILAQYDDDTIVVYQAYKPSIGHYAAQHKKFEGAPGWLTRMTWVKTNFLWMMFRSGWGSKINQEVTLAIWLKREAFDELLSLAVHSTFVEPVYEDRETWKKAVSNSYVRLQWDPDHHPSGSKLQRRAIQLGLKGEAATKLANGEWIVDIQDISDFVAEQSLNAMNDIDNLIIAKEHVYVVENVDVATKLGVD